MKSIYPLSIALIVLSLLSGYTHGNSVSQDQSDNETIIREAVAHQLNKKPEEVTPDDYINLESLSCSNAPLCSLEPIQRMTNLRELWLYLELTHELV